MADLLTRDEPTSTGSTVAASARTPSTVASLISGSVGGAAQVIIGQPLDTLKVRAQLAKPGQYRNTWDIATQTVRREGFLALYKGMASPLVGIAGVNALLFASFNQAKRIVSPYPVLSIPQIALAGALGGAVNSILASPVELFKIRMQGQYGAATDMKLRDVFSEMASKYGFRHGVMRGFWVTVLREMPAYAGFYSAYEFSKRTFGRRLHGPHASANQSLPVWATLTAGATGGIAYWTACYPLDVVKSRVQNTTTPLRGLGYIRDTFRTIYREEGFGAFFRGLTPTYIRAVPAAASTFVAFELTMDFLQKNTSL
ncbi:hypothetical protein EMMF5_000335 [Cystobasidiomycetes sp. EMM_F5]